LGPASGLLARNNLRFASSARAESQKRREKPISDTPGSSPEHFELSSACPSGHPNRRVRIAAHRYATRSHGSRRRLR